MAGTFALMGIIARFVSGSLIVGAASVGVVAAPTVLGVESMATAAPQTWFTSTTNLGYSYGLSRPTKSGPDQLTMRTRKNCLVYFSRVSAPGVGKKTIVTIRGRNDVPGRFDSVPSKAEFQAAAVRLGCA